ncbi:MAG TPA: sodium-translocating pyrophosphatase [Kofleriaceae bacterium]|nr:sodium-translocating pyrophosphatase [Kofleriaceae bacterium]
MINLAAGSALLAIAVAVVSAIAMLRADEGTARMRAVADAIREGAAAFLRRELFVIAIVAAVLAIAIAAGFGGRGAELAGGFLLGALGSAAASVFGVLVSVRANVRTAAVASRATLQATLRFAFGAGSVIGLGVAGLAALELVGCYLLFGGDVPALAGLLVGASLISLFARVGGGIYTKGADIGADLVGKLEIQIAEDDPRNPAVIADNVGDNVGDCGGMAADLFETFLVTAVAAMLLGYLIADVRVAFPNAVLFPVAVIACGILATIAGTLVVYATRRHIEGALYGGVAATLLFAAIGLWLLCRWLMNGNTGVFVATLTGLVVVVALVLLTNYYTAARFRPVARILRSTEAGAGPVVIMGMSVGLASVWLPGLVIAAGMLVAFFATGYTSTGIDGQLGLYGVGLAATSMLAVMGMIISIDAFGPIVDNAGGITELAALPAETRAITDRLDAAGNTTKAITKGYAIGSAALAALTLFAAFTFAAADQLAMPWSELTAQLRLDNPVVLAGLLVGALLPFVFTSLLMNAVGVAARATVLEVRRQFAEIAGLAAGTARPEYGRCVSIVTSTALRKLIAPGAIAVLGPLAVGLLLGPLALAGVLLGVILSGLPLALVMTTSGAAWDNAKKYLERGGRTAALGAAIVGDTVGDAMKDTAGPALNPLVKVVNSVSLLCVGLIAHRGLP